MQICTVPTVLTPRRHLEAPLYVERTNAPDRQGKCGDVRRPI